jgi:mannose-1-phosphate guanylyltransferase
LYAPEVYETSKIAWENNQAGNLDLELSMAIPSISIDYAVMERSKKKKVVSSQFEWSDLGSFESVYDYLIKIGHPVDENGIWSLELLITRLLLGSRILFCTYRYR